MLTFLFKGNIINLFDVNNNLLGDLEMIDPNSKNAIPYIMKVSEIALSNPGKDFMGLDFDSRKVLIDYYFNCSIPYRVSSYRSAFESVRYHFDAIISSSLENVKDMIYRQENGYLWNWKNVDSTRRVA